MELEKLEKATKIYNDLKKLEKDFMEISSLASKIKDGKFNINLKVDLEDKNKASKTKVGFDADGSLVIGEEYQIVNPFNIFGSKPKTPEKLSDFSSDITDSTLLNILAFLLAEKDKEKNVLIKNLVKMGVKIS